MIDYNKIVSLVYDARNIVFEKSVNLEVKDKNPYDFVTAVDMGISAFLKKSLYELYPEVGFVTEEESEHLYKDKYFILDPIDGTTNLIYDYKMSSVSLAYVENKVVKFGVVFNPFTEELFFSVKGKGAYVISTKNGIDELIEIGIENYSLNPLRVKGRELKKSIIEFGASSSKKHLAPKTFKLAQAVFENCLDLRRVCSTAISLCYIAASRLDGYFERIIKPWDYAAGILILKEAGGESSDWNGESLPIDREGTIVCSNSVIHKELLEIINKTENG